MACRKALFLGMQCAALSVAITTTALLFNLPDTPSSPNTNTWLNTISVTDAEIMASIMVMHDKHFSLFARVGLGLDGRPYVRLRCLHGVMKNYGCEGPNMPRRRMKGDNSHGLMCMCLNKTSIQPVLPYLANTVADITFIQES